MVTWRELILEAIELNNDRFVSWTLTDEQADAEFDDEYGLEEGAPFTAWGDEYVYFPVCYDGSEWVGCAPRNPCDRALSHQGG